MSRSVWISWGGNFVSSTKYAGVQGNAWDVLANVHNAIPVAGTVSNLRVHLTTAPGGPQLRTFHLMKNGSATALTVSLKTTTDAIDSTNTVSVSAGDTLAIRQIAGSGINASEAFIAMDFSSSVAAESVLMGGGSSGNDANTRYLPPMGRNVSLETDLTKSENVFAGSFTLSKMYVELSAAPGSSQSREFEYMKNGVATGLKVSISGTSTSGTDLTNSFSVVAGDTVTIRDKSTGLGAPAGGKSRISCKAVADTDGQFMMMLGTAGTFPAFFSGTAKFAYSGGYGGISTTESAHNCVSNAFTAKSLYVESESSDVGGGWDILLRRNVGDTTLRASITAGNKTANGTTDISVAGGDLIDFDIDDTGIVFTGSPGGKIGLLCAPPAPSPDNAILFGANF